MFNSPFKKHYKKVWSLVFPFPPATYLSVTNHKSLKANVLDAVVDNYYVIPSYPEIHGSIGVSINVHRNDTEIKVTMLGYPNRFKNATKFLQTFKKNIEKNK